MSDGLTVGLPFIRGVAHRDDVNIMKLTNHQSVHDFCLGRAGLVAQARERRCFIENSGSAPELPG